MQKGAKPAKVVEERHKQFLRRMSRHWLDNAAKEQQMQQQEEEEERQMRGGHGNGYGGVYDEDDVGDENRRGVLTGLTEEGVRQNNRARGLNSYTHTGQGVLGQRNGNGQSNSNQGNHNGVAPKAAFSVFTDENADDDNGGYDLNQSTMYQNDENQIPIPRIVKEKERKKENTQSAECWNERGGLNSHMFGYGGSATAAMDDVEDGPETHSSVARRWAGTGSDSIVAGGTSSQQAFQVFVDEDCEQKNSESNDKATSRMKRPASRGRGNERTLRQRLDDCTVSWFCYVSFSFVIVNYTSSSITTFETKLTSFLSLHSSFLDIEAKSTIENNVCLIR